MISEETSRGYACTSVSLLHLLTNKICMCCEPVNPKLFSRIQEIISFFQEMMESLPGRGDNPKCVLPAKAGGKEAWYWSDLHPTVPSRHE